jgi:hypothetical protein
MLPYDILRTPKYQSALHGTGHWDYFGASGGIQPSGGHPAVWCEQTGMITSEIVNVFLAKHLLGMWYLGPYLFSSPFGRPPVLPLFQGGGPCAVKVRWNEPGAGSSLGEVGEVTLGNWTGGSPW